ncbi:nucleolar protein dao-5-like [Saccostrea echinata]|uniref:nucleolar protein dao-5-like n=1 Tax=Saccostrea echinata TaxID=191078 RepID=UPI002A817FE6|nr:nucleolar protein dao-5-like [Saccostrea echinata]
MEEFVRKLVKKSDLSLLTKGTIKKAYKNKVGREITADEKNTLNLVLKNILTDINQHGGDKENAQSLASPLKRVESLGKHSPVKKKEKSAVTLQSPRSKKTSRTSLSPKLRVDEVVDAVMKSSDDEDKEMEDEPAHVSPQKKKSPLKKKSPVKKAKQNVKKKNIDRIEDVVIAVLDSESEGDDDNNRDVSDEDENAEDSDEDKNEVEKEPSSDESDSESEYEPFKDESKFISPKKALKKNQSPKKGVNQKKRKRYSLSSDSDVEDVKISEKSSEDSSSEEERVGTKKSVKRKKVISSDSEQSEEEAKPKRQRILPSEKNKIFEDDFDSEAENKPSRSKSTSGGKTKSTVSKKIKTVERSIFSITEGSSSEDEGMSLAQIRKLSSSSQDSCKGDKTQSESDVKKNKKKNEKKDMQDKQKSKASHGKHSKKAESKTNVAGKKTTNKSKGKIQRKKKKVIDSEDDSEDMEIISKDSNSEEDVPLSVHRTTPPSSVKEATVESGKDDSDSDQDMPLSVHRKTSSSSVKEATEESGKDDSDSDQDAPLSGHRKTPSSSVKEVRTQSGKDKMDQGSDSSSDSESEASTKMTSPVQKIKKSKTTTGSDSSSDSESEASTKITSPVQKKKKSSKTTTKGSDSSSDSESGASAKIPSPVQKKKKSSKETKKISPSDGKEESAWVKELRKICRAVGILVTNTRHLSGCTTENQKINKLKQLLREAGMEGRPSMKKVEEVRLMKEAAELDTHNILKVEGRGKRKVNSLFSRSDNSPKVKATPPREKFSRLRDIIDSDSSD